MHYRRDFLVPRRRVLRSLFSRRGLVVTLRAEVEEGNFIAIVDVTSDPKPPKPRWPYMSEAEREEFHRGGGL